MKNQLSGIPRVFALILLAGCATKPATVEVKVPVYVPCAKVVPRPAFAAPLLPAAASEGEKVLALARDTLLHFEYEAQLEAVIAGCL
ncbi:MAG: hypothetical protein WKG03_02875 [Telluria sp.]